MMPQTGSIAIIIKLKEEKKIKGKFLNKTEEELKICFLGFWSPSNRKTNSVFLQ